MFGKIVILCMVAACAGAPFDPSGRYEPSQFGSFGQIRAIEQKVNDMEAKEHMMESRQSAMTEAIKQELTKLELDTKTVKTVLNTLAEDNVKMHNDIQLLKGHSAAIINLGRKMMKLEQTMDGIQNTLADILR
ncbi:uncharacterized protein LOC123565734 [Mercenaria mercenaria]|uniref:uncharacterized protein LOC123565734 n=1 Tax=Mercenaria mercenaria TaxID=6596 RepID=UPI001E1D5AB2|nr:uncharacterized protein LOC123565734 [Mercenaria mercenaria]